jgi:hypothetical protein
MILTCCSKSTPSAEEVTIKKLTASTWMMKTVTVDNVDQTAVYKGLTIKFTSTGFSTTSGGIVWPSSGTWTFNSTDGTTIKRDDGIIVTVLASDSSLKLTLNWTKTTLGKGRVSSVSGKNEFTFGK